MPTKIVMTVDEDLTAQEVEDLRYMFADALGEFASRRADVDAYMAKRYPSDQAFGEKWLETKTEQVVRRVRLARKLHNAALGHRVTHVVEETMDMHASAAAFTNQLRDYAQAHASWLAGGPAVTKNFEAAFLLAVESALDAGLTLHPEPAPKRRHIVPPENDKSGTCEGLQEAVKAAVKAVPAEGEPDTVITYTDGETS